MLNQTFSLIDIPSLLTLILLEGILSLDNAVAIAVIAHKLPAYLKKKALFIGLASAFILRALGILVAAYMIQLFWVQLLGGGYLIYLSIKHLCNRKDNSVEKSKQVKSFWIIVLMIEMTDCLFAIDSILAGLAITGTVFQPPNLPPKMWIIYLGGMIGLILMRFAANLFTKLIKKHPRLELSAHLIIGWVGLKLLIETISRNYFYLYFSKISLWVSPVFWIGIGFIILFGFYRKNKFNFY